MDFLAGTLSPDPLEIHLVVVWLYQLQFALFLCEELLDVLRGLVVHDVEFDF